MPKKLLLPVRPETVEFPIVTAKTLTQHIQLSRHQLVVYRAELTKDIHWFQRIPGAEILYNLRLWKHYILAGQGWEHDRLVQEYLDSIPKPRL